MYEVSRIGGVTFIFSRLQGRETAALGVFLKIGSRYEKGQIKGIAHFLEHLLFKGSKNYSCRRIKREIEGRGGSLNGFTSQEITAYYAQFLNKNLGRTLDILLDLVLNPLIKHPDIEKERNVILEEIKMYEDQPVSRTVSLLDKLLWEKHPLGRDVIGSAATVKRIKRQDLLAFKQKYYAPSNLLISFSGSFAKEKIITAIKRKIAPLKFRGEAKLKSTPPKALRGLAVKIEKKSLEQAHLCLGFRGVSYLSPARFTFELINIILGANMSSRLFEELREKRGLCYDVSTEARKYKDSGAFIVHLGLDEKKILTAFKTVAAELKKIKEKKVLPDELSRAKDFFIGQAAMALERPYGRMFYGAESYLTRGRIDSFRRVKKEVMRVSRTEIQRFSKRLFNFSRVCISCVGNLGEGLERKLREIVKQGK